MKQISDIFKAHPTSAADFMRERGQGFYVPAYQRQFSWGKMNIERLFDDVSHGIHQLIQREDATTFIGTLITIHDTDYATVDPIVRGQVPGRVMTVIDGQQRLTTLLLINVALHNELHMRHMRFRDKRTNDPALCPPSDVNTWIHDHSVETLSELIETIEENMSHGDGDYQYYPRMIRAYEDRWSRRASEARYASEIASLLHHYGAHVRATPTKPFRPPDTSISASYTLIRTTLRRAIALGTHTEIEFPPTSDLGRSDYLGQTLFNDRFPDDMLQVLIDPEGSGFQELFRLLIFARFVLHRVAITVVIARSEDYAFDMFESLNTTGEPLTAFETFKPRVIREEGYGDYQSSESERYMRHVETYLGNFTTAHSRQRPTNDLLIPFALAESGSRLSKRLSDQRRYLKDSYESLEQERKLGFLRQMAHTALLLQDTWDTSTRPPAGPALSGTPELSGQEKLCLDVLQSAKHSIAIAPLSRFYSAKLEGHDVSIGCAAQATTAFFGLWRGAMGSTAGIEDKYRTLMARGSEDHSIPPLARQNSARSGHPVPSIESLRAYFRLQLEEKGLGTRKDWVQAAMKIPVYSVSKPLTRLLLLAAIHDTIEDPESPGLVKKARGGRLSLLNYDSWADDANITVEHIAPQNPAESTDWRDSLYAQPETVDQIGNLLLLPRARNTSLSNRSWTDKRAIYRILSAQSFDEADAAFENAKRLGVNVTRDILDETYLPLTAGVAVFDGFWDVDIVEQRSERLLSLAWDRLAPWLGYE